jgi:hypothetical protein
MCRAQFGQKLNSIRKSILKGKHPMLRLGIALNVLEIAVQAVVCFAAGSSQIPIDENTEWDKSGTSTHNQKNRLANGC